MPFKTTNNAESTLDAALTDSATSLTVSTGEGARFPTMESGDWFPLYIQDATDVERFEIVSVTARAGDTLSITRGSEGTTPLAFNASDIVSLRLTQRAVESFASSGVKSFTVLDGLNYAQAGGSANALTATISDITSYTDGLQVRVRSLSANTTAAVTINVNGLGAAPIQQRDAQVLEFGGIQPNTVVDLTYSDSDAAFILNNPVVQIPATPVASTVQQGIVQLADDDTAFATGGDNTEAMTPRSTSRMVEDYFLNSVTPKFPSPYTYTGDGSDGTGTGASGFLVPGLDYNFLTYTVSSAQTVEGKNSSGTTARGAGTIIIRSQGKVTISGTIILGDGSVPQNAVAQFVGPGAKFIETQSTAEDEPRYANPERPYIQNQGSGAAISALSLVSALKQGIPMQWIRGSMGRHNWTEVQIRGDQHEGTHSYVNGQGVYPCGGLVIIAPEVEFTSTAKVVMASRTNPALAAGEADSAGGIIVCMCAPNNVTVNASAQFAAGFSHTTYRTATQWSADRGINGQALDPDADTRKNEAANGQMFAVNPSSAAVNTIF